MGYHDSYIVKRTTVEQIRVVADSAEEARLMILEMTVEGEVIPDWQIEDRTQRVSRATRVRV